MTECEKEAGCGVTLLIPALGDGGKKMWSSRLVWTMRKVGETEAERDRERKKQNQIHKDFCTELPL